MTRSTRGVPISTEVYLRGKSPLLTRSIRAITRSVTLPPPPAPNRARPVPRQAPPPPAPAAQPVPDTADAGAPAREATPARGAAAPGPPGPGDRAAGRAAPRVEAGADPRGSAAAPAEGAVSVVVVDPDEVVRTVLKDHITTLQLPATAYDSLAPFAAAPGAELPRVLVLGPSEAPGTVIEGVAPLIARRPRCRAVMLVSELSGEIVRSAFRAGIDDVVALSAEHTELLDAIARSVALLRGQQETGQGSGSSRDHPTPVTTGRIVTIFGTKGGTGKSVVATNLAVSLARQTAQPVVLVDANLQFGDAAIMLQLRPEHTINEAALAGDRLDAEVLESLLLRHKPTGLRVLAAPADPVSADQVDRSDVHRILTLLRTRFAYVVVDTSPRIEESTLVSLQDADDIVILTTPDVMSLKNARLGLQTLHALGIPRERVKLVLNQATVQSGLTRADAERAMRMKVDAALPNDPLVGESVNRGTPAVLAAPSSKFVLGIDDLARALRAARATSPRPSPEHVTPAGALAG